MTTARFNWYAFRCDLREITGAKDLPSEATARAIRRDIARHHTLQEHNCNGFATYDDREDVAARQRSEARERGVERRLRAFFGDLVTFEGDPRGGTVKIDAAGRLDRGARYTYFGRDLGGNLIYVGK
jgi:hypothetical protein